MISVLVAGITLACLAIARLPLRPLSPTAIPTTALPTRLPPIPVQPGQANPDEPVFVSGELHYTSRFFLNTISEPFVLLEDEAGFVHRDLDFEFQLTGQTIGPIIDIGDNTLRYELALPAIPQGTSVDLDHDGNQDAGVQVFAIAYWSNIWGGPFLEKRDGVGWSTAYASTITDPDRENEIKGGILIAWAPDENQGFPSGFGDDRKLFTEDDPISPIPAGYNLVDLNSEPFRFYKESRPSIPLNEGIVAVNDYSKMSYQDAFEAFFKKASQEYPFTKEKAIDWQILYDQFSPQVAKAKNDDDFYLAIRQFLQAIPDGHVGFSSFNANVFNHEIGGGLGLVLAQLSDGKVIASQVIKDSPADRAGVKVGAEIVSWNNQPIQDALDKVIPYFLGPSSTPHHRRMYQLIYLTRMPVDTRINLSLKNPGDSQDKPVNLVAQSEFESFFRSMPALNLDPLNLPVQGKTLEDSGLGYIRISSFSDDYKLMAHLWDQYIRDLNEKNVPGLILDLRTNGGGNSRLAENFAGYFFEKEITLYKEYYFSQTSRQFEPVGLGARISPGPRLYKGPLAVLISADCASACEGFTYALHQENRAIVVGYTPSAGMFGEVGRGQYQLPGNLSLQIPTGRPQASDGSIPIEGIGVIPDITVPITLDSALGKTDTVLEAAIQALLKEIK